jgi:hypothetical protein
LLLLAAVVALLATACGSTNHNAAAPVTVTVTAPTTTTPPPAKAVPVVDADNWSCLKSDLDSAGRCPYNPDFGKTRAQVRAESIAKAKAAQRKKIAAAKAAEARRARVAAENAWHTGYFQQDENVYWRWINGKSCQEFAENGCWHVEVITRDGCPSYVAVNANEYQDRAIVNELLDNQGYGIPAKTPRVFELDADEGNVSVGNVSVECD